MERERGSRIFKAIQRRISNLKPDESRKGEKEEEGRGSERPSLFPPFLRFNRGRATKPSIKRDKHNATMESGVAGQRARRGRDMGGWMGECGG